MYTEENCFSNCTNPANNLYSLNLFHEVTPGDLFTAALQKPLDLRDKQRLWPFCHWHLCKGQITAIARGKANGTLHTINCLCWLWTVCCTTGCRQAMWTNTLLVWGASWPLVTNPSSPHIYHCKWWVVCLSLLYMHLGTAWQRVVSCLELFSTGIHGENPGWILSWQAFWMFKSAQDRPSRFKQIN